MDLIGTDPGLAHFGLACLTIESLGVRVDSLHLYESQKSTRKVLIAVDNAQRAQGLAVFLRDKIPDGTVAICSEGMSWPRNLVAVSRTAIAWGVLVAVAAERQIPLIQMSPQEIKETVCGSRNASKRMVREELEKRYPVVGGMWDRRKSKIEHQADALAAATVALRSDVVLAACRASGIHA